MRLVVISRIEIRSVVFDNDLNAAVRLAGLDIDMERIKFGIKSVFYRVFDNRLQGQRGQAEVDDRRVKFIENLPLKASLLHCKICL